MIPFPLLFNLIDTNLGEMNNQSVTASWKLLEDFPTRDGDYIVAFRTTEGYGYYEPWEFVKGEWFACLDTDSLETPSYWIDIPPPK